MVYHGPSRGCRSCRSRRKKCDETRPSCMRCTKANRPCGGYEIDNIRSYRAPEEATPAATSIARRCVLPKRVPNPITGLLPEDGIPSEATEEESNHRGLACFLYDFVAVSANQNLSLSYLPNLETFIRPRGHDFDVAKACRAVAFASHSKPMSSPYFLQKGEFLHQELLSSLVKSIGSSNADNVVELKYLALILGLYQIVMTDESNMGDYAAHAGGLLTLMGLDPPLSCTPTDVPMQKFWGMLRVPALNTRGERLDDLLVDLERLSIRCDNLCDPEEWESLGREALSIEQRFVDWENNRPTEFKPATAGHIKQPDTDEEAEVAFWPGRVDTYFEIYISAVWNLFRASRLFLVCLIAKISQASFGRLDCTEHIYTATRAAEDILASVPYLLSENLQELLAQQDKIKEIPEAGRLLGGMLLMHPLYTMSQIPFLPDNLKKYSTKCLMWIGSEMGIGLATVLAKNPNIDNARLMSACTILWSGFLM